MAPGKSYEQVAHVEHGPGTGDKVYVLKDGRRIEEPFGRNRVRVVEGSKFGPTLIEVK